MKLLKRISLVQWFLYETEDFPIAFNTAFLGPNGTGKTCLLDAVQTVMLGADQQRLHFNAQADGKKRDRSLRSYCLGVLDEGVTRESAATYVLLGFQDDETGQCVTAGVALSARVDTPEVTFHALFLLPGVLLSARDFVRRENGRDLVIPWKEAQLMFREKAREADAATPEVTTNREEFVRRLLLDHLAARGDHPNTTMFRNAFQRSVHLKVMDDLNAALRDHLIEAHPTRIRDFKERADQFRKMRDLVARIRDQIEHLDRIGMVYDRVRSQRVREANYTVLSATLQVEAIGAREAELDEKVENLGQKLEHAIAENRRHEAAHQDARAAEREALDARSRDPKYQAYAATSQLLHDRERALSLALQSITQELQTMWKGIADVAAVPGPDADPAPFQRAAAAVQAITDAAKRGSLPDPASLQHLSQELASCAKHAQRRISASGAALAAAREERDLAKIAAERTSRGLARLEDNVQTLQLRLKEAGIESTPVCDLIEVTDPRWQPAIEAYLGKNNVQALVVSRTQEEAAVALYRSLKRNDSVYGAKIVAPSRLRVWQSPGNGKYAAALIEGETPDAVQFVRGELGRIECVESERELLRASKAMTADGMIAAGAGIDRRMLSDALRIGRHNREVARVAAEHELRRASEAFEQLDRSHKFLSKQAQGLSGYSSSEGTLARLSQLVLTAETHERGVADAKEQQRAAAGGDASTLEARVLETQEAAERASKNHLHWNGQVSSFRSALESEQAHLSRLREERSGIQQRERTARSHPLYDPNEVERLRGREDSAKGETTIDIVESCRDKASAAGRLAGAAENEATSLISTYTLQFNANFDLPVDWTGRAKLIHQEHSRLRTLALAEKEAEAEEALKAAERVFRSDVVHSLLAGFQRIKDQVDVLNVVLDKAPEFSNRERYHFQYGVIDAHKPLHKFLERVEEQGTEDSLFGNVDQMPPEFRELMEADASSPLLAETSPLYDCRRFFAYDVEIQREGKPIGHLSKRFGPGSGGEHRTPLYVIFGAALAAAYGNLHGHHAGGGLMLLDEAFDKMDATNVRAVAGYLNALGLQLLMAGPETDQTKLSSFLHSYFDLSRHGSRTIRVEHNIVGAAARELLESDNPLFHPELVELEIRRLRGEEEEEDGSVAVIP